MRPTALIPALCCLAALILSFLCLFAGSKKDFMEDYHIMTLNTSRIGYNVIDTLSSTDSPLADITNLIPDSLESEINNRVGDVAQRLGVDDFYSVHILNFCYGDYTPGPLPNATLSSSDISKKVDACSNMTALFHFQPADIIEQKLNESGVGVTLEDLDWPSDIQRGIDALHILQTAVFVLYVIAIILIFLSLVFALIALFTAGRLSACLNVLVAVLAFLAIGIASALITAVAVKGEDIINQHGESIGIEAKKGSKFLALTWAATALVLISMVWWCVETCIGRRTRERSYAKHG